MAQVKPESKEILINLQFCEPKNLLEKKRILLVDIFVMTLMDLPGKQAPVEHMQAYMLYMYICRSTSTLKILVTVAQTETQRLNMTAQH